MEGGGGCAAPPTKNVLHATRAKRGETGTRGGGQEHQHCYLRDLSCLLRCSLLEKARLQNWHLYFFSGSDDFLICDDDAVGRTFMAAAGMFFWGGFSVRVLMLAGCGLSSPVLFFLRAMVESSGARAWA
jgi:hypothetical protein